MSKEFNETPEELKTEPISEETRAAARQLARELLAAQPDESSIVLMMREAYQEEGLEVPVYYD